LLEILKLFVYYSCIETNAKNFAEETKTREATHQTASPTGRNKVRHNFIKYLLCSISMFLQPISRY